MTRKNSLLLLLLLSSAPLFAGSLRQAYSDFNSGKFAEAAEGFKEQAQKEPWNYDQQYNTGVALFQKGEFVEASNYFDRAKQSADPKLKSKAAYNKGLAMAQQQQWDSAEHEFQEALSYDNDNPMIRDNLAWAQQQKKKQKPEDRQDQQDQKSEQDQKTAQEQAGQDAKSGPNNPAEKDKKIQQNQNDKSESKDAQNGEKKPSKDAGAPDDKNASEKRAEQQASQPSKPTQKQSSADAAQGQPGEKEQGLAPNHQTNKQAIDQALTIKDLKKQEAEKLLRSVDDHIGSYTLTPDQTAVEGKSRNGKEW